MENIMAILTSRPLCTKRPPKKRWIMNIPTEGLVIGVVLYADIECPPDQFQYVYFLELVQLVNGQPTILGHITCEKSQKDGVEINILGTFEKGQHLHYGGNFPTLNDWMPVAMKKVLEVASLYFPGKKLEGEWEFHHDFDPSMPTPDIEESPMAKIIALFHTNGVLSEQIKAVIIELLKEEIPFSQTVVLIVTQVLGTELAANEEIMAVVVDMLRNLCVPESLIPVHELTNNEMETELRIIWCEKYKLSEEAGLNEAKMMMGKIGLAACRNYIQNYRNEKLKPFIDSLKPVDQMSEDELREEISEFFASGKTEFYQNFYANFYQNSGMPDYEGDRELIRAYFEAYPSPTLMQIIPGLRKIKAQYPYTEDDSDDSSSSDDGNDNAKRCVQCGKGFVANEKCEFSIFHKSSANCSKNVHTHKDKHHCDYVYANLFTMIFNLNNDGKEKTHKILGLLCDKQSERRQFCKVAKVLRMDEKSSLIKEKLLMIQVGSVIPGDKFWFRLYSPEELSIIAQKKEAIIYRTNESSSEYSSAKWIFNNNSIEGVCIEVKSKNSSQAQTKILHDKSSVDGNNI